MLNHHMDSAGDADGCTGTSQCLQNEPSSSAMRLAGSMCFKLATCKVIFLERKLLLPVKLNAAVNKSGDGCEGAGEN